MISFINSVSSNLIIIQTDNVIAVKILLEHGANANAYNEKDKASVLEKALSRMLIPKPFSNDKFEAKSNLVIDKMFNSSPPFQ